MIPLIIPKPAKPTVITATTINTKTPLNSHTRDFDVIFFVLELSARRFFVTCFIPNFILSIPFIYYLHKFKLFYYIKIIFQVQVQYIFNYYSIQLHIYVIRQHRILIKFLDFVYFMW